MIPTNLEASNWCLQLDELLELVNNHWSDLLACVRQANQTLGAKKSRRLFRLLPLLLKKIETLLNSRRFPPSSASLLGPRCGSLHMRVSALCYGWSALVCLHLIGGGQLEYFGTHTQQVSWQLAVYTSPWTQPITPLCDWFTLDALHILSTLSWTFISTHQPIKGITKIDRNLKKLMKVILDVKLFWR